MMWMLQISLEVSTWSDPTIDQPLTPDHADSWRSRTSKQNVQGPVDRG